MDPSDLDRLDKQEIGYNPISVDVEADGGQIMSCRTYVQNEEYKATVPPGHEMISGQLSDQLTSGHSSKELTSGHTGDQMPSWTYKTVILKGAIEHDLPESYIDGVIRAYRDNGVKECSLSHVLQ